MKKQKGFTLIEMLIVLFVISVIVLITIPNISRSKESANGTGCDAYQKVVAAQVEAFYLKEKKYPTIDELVSGKYIPKKTCPNEKELTVTASGEVAYAATP